MVIGKSVGPEIFYSFCTLHVRCPLQSLLQNDTFSKAAVTSTGSKGGGAREAGEGGGVFEEWLKV